MCCKAAGLQGKAAGCEAAGLRREAAGLRKMAWRGCKAAGMQGCGAARLRGCGAARLQLLSPRCTTSERRNGHHQRAQRACPATAFANAHNRQARAQQACPAPAFTNAHRRRVLQSLSPARARNCFHQRVQQATPQLQRACPVPQLSPMRTTRTCRNCFHQCEQRTTGMSRNCFHKRAQQACPATDCSNAHPELLSHRQAPQLLSHKHVPHLLSPTHSGLTASRFLKQTKGAARGGRRRILPPSAFHAFQSEV